MRARFGDTVIGLDSNLDSVSAHQKAGRNVILGDATDSDFWQRLQPGQVQLVMLTLPELSADLDIVRILSDNLFDGKIAAVVRYEDQFETLEQAGVHLVVDSLTEAGAGFADHVQKRFATELDRLDPPNE
jgi:hypothetical protein